MIEKRSGRTGDIISIDELRRVLQKCSDLLTVPLLLLVCEEPEDEVSDKASNVSITIGWLISFDEQAGTILLSSRLRPPNYSNEEATNIWAELGAKVSIDKVRRHSVLATFVSGRMGDSGQIAGVVNADIDIEKMRKESLAWEMDDSTDGIPRA